MSGISYPSAFLLGVFLECVMYGIFVPLFITACYVQRERVLKGQGLNRLLAFATAFFGVSVTVGVAISISFVLRAIVYTPSGVTLDLSPAQQVTAKGIVRFMILQLQTTVGDVVVIYRMYHIYNRNPFICIAPSIVTAATLAVACVIVVQLRDIAAHQKTYGSWVISDFCFIAFNNLFLTTAISYKLWRVHRGTVRVGIHVEDSIMLRVVMVLIESAALWAAFALINILTFLAGSNVTYLSASMTSPAVGISFCLITVRLGKILPGSQGGTQYLSGSSRIPASRTVGPDQVAVSFTQVKAQQGVCANGSDGLPMEALGSQKEEYVDSSGDLPKIIRSESSSLSPQV